ncbi:MAG: hypothetical protein LBW85_01040, partial [Deltaproteobacteria bacterium]|nr:hypothetical protein [Deltaproteobacteria bacterium]
GLGGRGRSRALPEGAEGRPEDQEGLDERLMALPEGPAAGKPASSLDSRLEARGPAAGPEGLPCPPSRGPSVALPADLSLSPRRRGEIALSLSLLAERLRPAPGAPDMRGEPVLALSEGPAVLAAAVLKLRTGPLTFLCEGGEAALSAAALADLNGEEGRIFILKGPLARALKPYGGLPEGGFPLAVACLPPAMLTRHLGALSRLLAPRGRLIAVGPATGSQTAAVLKAASRAGLSLGSSVVMGEAVGLCLDRPLARNASRWDWKPGDWVSRLTEDELAAIEELGDDGVPHPGAEETALPATAGRGSPQAASALDTACPARDEGAAAPAADEGLAGPDRSEGTPGPATEAGLAAPALDEGPGDAARLARDEAAGFGGGPSRDDFSGGEGGSEAARSLAAPATRAFPPPEAPSAVYREHRPAPRGRAARGASGKAASGDSPRRRKGRRALCAENRAPEGPPAENQALRSARPGQAGDSAAKTPQGRAVRERPAGAPYVQGFQDAPDALDGCGVQGFASPEGQGGPSRFPSGLLDWEGPGSGRETQPDLPGRRPEELPAAAAEGFPDCRPGLSPFGRLPSAAKEPAAEDAD